jgi:tetratricopeptide (TPR) repeat protein
MRRFAPFVLTVVLLISVDAIAVERGERERSFVRALELFDAATSPDDYRESAKVLESILADGFRSGVVYYNLGNAYYRAGEYGRAILNYRKAKPYRPRDPYLSANLEQALVAAPGRLAESPRPWWIHVLFWTDWLSFPTKVQAVFVGTSLAAISLGLAVVLRLPRLHWLTLGLLFGSLAIGIDTGLGYTDIEGSRRAVITKDTIARKGTGNSYEAAFDQPLRDGAEFTVLGETSDWTFGRFENIGDGWVRNEFVAR